MDNLGAIVGPALATLFLHNYPGGYRTLFALTVIPGAIAVALIFLVIPRKRCTEGVATHGVRASAG